MIVIAFVPGNFRRSSLSLDHLRDLLLMQLHQPLHLRDLPRMFQCPDKYFVNCRWHFSNGRLQARKMSKKYERLSKSLCLMMKNKFSQVAVNHCETNASDTTGWSKIWILCIWSERGICSFDRLPQLFHISPDVSNSSSHIQWDSPIDAKGAMRRG